MKKLFIYYSNTGNGEVVSEYLKNKGIEIRRMETNYHLSKKLFPAMMKGGFDSLFKKKAKLINFNNNIDDYDVIYLGSPIWNGRLTPPMNRALSLLDLNNKSIVFILYSGGGECEKMIKRLEKKYPNCSCISLKEPKKYNEELNKLEEL